MLNRTVEATNSLKDDGNDCPMNVQGAHKWPCIQVIYGTSQIIHLADAVPTGSATL